MIYKFRMISGDQVPFLRDYEIDADSSFLIFHNFIQGDLNFDKHQLASFFLADEHWNKGMELTLLDMQNDTGFAAIPMETVKLCDLLKTKKERLLYIFDIFSDRAFFIEIIDIFEPKASTSYPLCTSSIGEAPEQILIDLNIDEAEEEDELFDDSFNDFSSDEDFGFDPEAFSGNEDDY
jgi:hypothetical protein